MTRDLLICLGLMSLSAAVLLAGCDKKQPTTQAERPGPEVVQRDTPRDADPADPADPPALTDDPERETPRDPAPEDPAPVADRPDPPAADRAARTPFPREGESVRVHIAPTHLSDHDPFENTLDPEDIPDVVPWEEAGEYVGHTITVEGRIVNLGKSGNVNFLNYDRDWRGKFYLVIFDDLAETLDGTVEETFLNELIRVTGEVEEHRGRPQIKIESMDQVEFVEEE